MLPCDRCGHCDLWGACVKRDVHLTASFEPLKEKQSVATLCGKQIDRAAFPFIVEGDLRMRTVDALGSCQKCIKQVFSVVAQMPGRVYVYGVVSERVEIEVRSGE